MHPWPQHFFADSGYRGSRRETVRLREEIVSYSACNDIASTFLKCAESCLDRVFRSVHPAG